MAKEFSVIIEQDTEGYYVASVPGPARPALDAMMPTFFSKVNQPALVTGRRRRQGLRRRERAQSRASQHQGGTPRTS